jgi:uncharacterized membrane protein YcaP (DUF421 family)
LANKEWRPRTLSKMRIQDDDVMDVARDQGIRDLSGVETAVLESIGQITVTPSKQEQESEQS